MSQDFARQQKRKGSGPCAGSSGYSLRITQRHLGPIESGVMAIFQDASHQVPRTVLRGLAVVPCAAEIAHVRGSGTAGRSGQTLSGVAGHVIEQKQVSQKISQRFRWRFGRRPHRTRSPLATRALRLQRAEACTVSAQPFLIWTFGGHVAKTLSGPSCGFPRDTSSLVEGRRREPHSVASACEGEARDEQEATVYICTLLD